MNKGNMLVYENMRITLCSEEKDLLVERRISSPEREM